MRWFSKKEEPIDWNRKVWDYIRDINIDYELVVTIKQPRIDYSSSEGYRHCYRAFGYLPSEEIVFGINHKGSYKKLHTIYGRTSIQRACELFYCCLVDANNKAVKVNVIESMGSDWVHPPKVEPVVPVISDVVPECNIAMTKPMRKKRVTAKGKKR
jgi:hypothetical protein